MDYQDGFVVGNERCWTAEDRAAWSGARSVDWTERGLRIVRIALLAHDWPMNHLHDVSYVLGMVGDEHVRVVNSPISWDSRTWKTDLLKWGRANKIYVKDMGVFDEPVIRWNV